jgi:hypothetical protein
VCVMLSINEDRLTKGAVSAAPQGQGGQQGQDGPGRRGAAGRGMLAAGAVMLVALFLHARMRSVTK